MDNFDLIVLGAGPGGYVAAIRAAQLGLKTAIIEKNHLGGVCLNWGCIPTKALLKSSEVYHTMKHAEEFGIKVKDVSFDIANVVKRSREVAAQLSKGIEFLLKKNKITVFSGHGEFKTNNIISIKDQTNTTEITAKNIVIATGARPRILPNLEPDGKFIWDYKQAMVPQEMPKSLLIIGSGAIGIEYASFYNAFGVDVTIVEIAPRILLSEDKEIASLAAENFTKRGIKIKTGSSVKNIVKNKNDMTVTLTTPGGEEKLTVSNIISAVGITPNTDDIGLKNVNVKLDDKNLIIIDDFMKTSCENIYAIGDITPGPWLAHKASHEAVIAVEKIAGLNPKILKRENIPGCIYSMPQMASIGIHEEKAKELGYKIKVGRFPYQGNGKAIALGEPQGLIKLIYEEQTGELLGAHMIGAEVTELISNFSLAKSAELILDDFTHTIFPHPTLSEMLHEASLSAEDRAIHS